MAKKARPPEPYKRKPGTPRRRAVAPDAPASQRARRAPPSSNDPTGLVQEVDDLYAKGVAFAQKRREQGLVNEAYIHDDQWDLIISRNGSQTVRKDAWYDDEEIPRQSVNEIGPAHQTWTALMTKDRPTVNAAPTNDAPESAYRAAIANVIIQFLEEKLDSANVVHKATGYAGMHGTGGIKVVIDVKRNEVVWSKLTIFDFVIDPGCDDYRDARWVIFEDFIDEDEARDALEAMGDQRKPKVDKYQNATGDDLEGVRRLELWYKPCRAHPDGLYAVIVSGVVVERRDDYPYVFEDDSGQPQYFLPIALMRMRDVRGVVYGSTNFSAAVPMQHGYNEMVSRITSELRARKSHSLMPNAVKEAYLANHTTLFFPPKDWQAAGAARTLDPGDVPAGFFSQRDFFRQAIPVVVGLNTVTAGTETRSLSGRAIDNIVELDEQKNADATKEQGAMVARAWQLTCLLVAHFYSDMRKAKISNADPQDIFAFNGTDFAGEDIRFEPANELDKTSTAKRNATAQDVQNGAATSMDMAATRTDGALGWARQQAEQLVQEVQAGQAPDIAVDDINLDVLNQVLAKYMARAIATRDRTSWLRLEQLRRNLEAMQPQAADAAPPPGAAPPASGAAGQAADLPGTPTAAM